MSFNIFILNFLNLPLIAACWFTYNIIIEPIGAPTITPNGFQTL